MWPGPGEHGLAQAVRTEEPGSLQSMGSQRVDMTEQLTLSLSFQFLEGDAALCN